MNNVLTSRAYSAFATGYDNKFYLMGGYRNNGINFGITRDLWEFDSVIDQWRKLTPADSSSPEGFYGEKGVYNLANDPRGRTAAIGWVDSLNNFYVFGGYWNPTDEAMNDLWRINVDSACPSIPTYAVANDEMPVVAYPNPFIDKLTINTSAAGTYDCKILNALGQVVFATQLRSPVSELAPNISAGIYLLTLTKAREITAIRVIKE